MHYHKSNTGIKLGCALFSASVLILVLAVAPQITLAQSLYSTFQKLKIPDLVPVSQSTATIRFVLNNNVVKPADPIPIKSFENIDLMKGVSWEPSDYEAKYTLMLLDLDRVPNLNGTLNIYNQYTNLNIPGNQIINGQAIVAFDTPSVPCRPSSKHRLVMLVFHQDQALDLSDVAYISASVGYSKRRENFKLSDFYHRHQLHLVAANVFLAVGDVNGVCSASSTMQPQYLITASMLILMVMVHKMMLR